MYLWQASLQTSQLFDFCSNSFFIISKMLLQKPRCFEVLPLPRPRPPTSPSRNSHKRLSTTTHPHPLAIIFTIPNMAASSEKSEEKKVDREGCLSQLVARYNYCVMRHPILTKSITRQVQLEIFRDLHIQVLWIAIVNRSDMKN